MYSGLASTWLALLAVNSVVYASEEPPAVTAAPIYLPYYNQESWSLVRGSVVSSVGYRCRQTLTGTNVY